MSLNTGTINYLNLKKYIQNHLKKTQSSGSILFYGSNNERKLELAMYMGLMLNCNNITKNNSCGSCDSCLRLVKFNHPDLHLLLPLPSEKKTEAEAIALWKKLFASNKMLSFLQWKKTLASETGIKKELSISSEKISQIKKTLSLKNFEAKKRIVLIWCSEKLTLQASNKLLKVLEEPPKNTYFFLIADDKHEMIDTVNSRLEKIHVKGTINSSILQNKTLLKNSLKNRETERKEEHENMNGFKKWMRACQSKNIVQLNEMNVNLSKQKKDGYINFIVFCQNKLRYIFRYSLGLENIEKNNKDKEFYINFSGYLKAEKILSLEKKMETALFYIERNANTKLLFLSLSIELFRVFDENKI